jgi:hypothetical protein
MTLKEYLHKKNTTSLFTTSMSDIGGSVTFSNSGRRGTVKEFTLGLDSFISILNDIKSNIDYFKQHENYTEGEWRNLGGTYFSDGPANAMSAVQTKALFTTVSKIITWANSPELEHIDTDQYIKIEDGALQNTLVKLKLLAKSFTPNIALENSIKQIENIVFYNKSIREFAKYLFTYFFEDNWHQILDNTINNISQINKNDFISHDFKVFKRLIGEFSSLQTKESLASSKVIRYFEEPFLVEDNKYYYLTTQWNGDGDYSLSFSNLKFFFEKEYNDYIIEQKNGNYYLIKSGTVQNIQFNIKKFFEALDSTGLTYSNNLVVRFVASQLTKPFVILTGLAGSGKTKLAQSFVQWICHDVSQYRLIPVGADWTNREPLLGYPNALKPEEYVRPDSGVLDLIIQANQKPDLPHFLILDEMNLSHVERYFADFLSVMESKDEIPLNAEGTVLNGIPSRLKVPSNLFIIGTVNIDETTSMFSPKVLDRANTIEFRVTQEEMLNFVTDIKALNMDVLIGKGAGMGKSFLELAENTGITTTDVIEINDALVKFFGELKKIGAEFGYRTATEIRRLIQQLTVLDNNLKTNEKIDISIIQKLLPKLHGSRRKLCPVLEMLGSFCISGDVNIIADIYEKTDFDYSDAKVLYPLSLEKIARMYRAAIDNGFASFAEA